MLSKNGDVIKIDTTGNLVPRAFSSAIFKMADRHFENRRGEGPGDEVDTTGFQTTQP